MSSHRSSPPRRRHLFRRDIPWIIGLAVLAAAIAVALSFDRRVNRATEEWQRLNYNSHELILRYLFLSVIVASALLLYCYFCAEIGALVGKAKEARRAGWWLGALLGPLGWILAAFVDGRAQCPACQGRIGRYAEICQWCRQPLDWDAPHKPRKARARPSA